MWRLVLILFISLGIVQSAQSSVRYINVSDGLSSRQVYEVEEDLDGFMWIYTNSGLDRFDGHNVKHYTLNPGEEQNDHIQSATSMELAPDGTLWIAVKSGAIYRYNRPLDRFEKAYSFADPSILLYNFTFSPDGNLVVCTNNGLYICSGNNLIDRMALDGKLVRAVIPDGNDGYYAGTDHGLYHIVRNGSSWRANFVQGTEGVHILSLALSSGKLYLGSFSRGVLTIDKNGVIGTMNFKVPPLPVNALIKYGGDSLLVGVDGAGVYLVDSSIDSLIYHFRDGDESEYDLSGNTITDMHVGKDNGIWIATSHNGLNYIPASTQSIKTIKSKKGNAASPVSDYINVVYEDSDGDIWYGTDHGVSRHSPSQNKWWHYLQRNDYVASVVLSFGEDSRGRILIGTYGDGLYVVDKKSGKVDRLPRQKPGTNSGVGTDYIFAGYGTPDGNVWIGGINGPLTRYNINDNSYHYYDEDCIATIINDCGSPLFGGNKGVGKYHPESDSFEWTQQFDSITIHYPVRVLLTDSIGDEMWIGTQGDGLVRFDRKKGTARLFTTADGLSSNTIYAIARGNHGGIWICTETDLYRYDPTDRQLRRFTSFLGTNRGVFNPGSSTSTRNGNIMIGTAEGCVMFNPAEDFKHSTEGNILFSDFKIHGLRVTPGDQHSPLIENINLSDRIKLSHNQNTFEIDLALINYNSPQRIGLEYMLEGYDAEPQHSGANASLRYTDLPSGKYTLIVKAIDLYSGEAFANRSLIIEIKPSVWMTPWAITLYIVIALGLLGATIAYWNRIRRERHIESQLRSYAAIAHDIRTPMSMIKSPILSVELESNLTDRARTNLRQARLGIDKTMNMLDEMLGLRRETNAPRLQVQPVDIIKYLQIKVEEYSTIAMFKGIELEYHVAPDLKTVIVDPVKFDHIVDNLFSNAIKYTNSGSITLDARLTGKRHWSLAVIDTGIGIKKEDARYVFKRRHRSNEAADCDALGTGLGLIITRRLVTEHKGKITFESNQGEGSKFIVTLPLNFATRYNAAKPIDKPESIDDEESQTDQSRSSESTRSTLVILDDDPDMLSYLKSQLKDDYNVIEIEGTPAALDEIKTLNPDLVISDVMMPSLRGDELCNILKTNIDTSHIPVILLTGLADRRDIVAGLEARADDYVIKPFDIVVLKARIRNIIKTRQELGKRILAEDCQPDKEEYSNELDRRFMTRTMEFINNNISDSEYSVNELCADLGMSRTSVYNKIKSISGQSPNEFMRIIRLNRAKELIESRRYNVSEVAYMVGFSDPKYFSTSFKKQFGFSPSKA